MPLNIAHLRIENEGDGTHEYRILDGGVQVRTVPLHSGEEPLRGAWHRLTAEQLSIHVERNTVVARWLELRMGWRRLLRACTGEDLTDRDFLGPDSGFDVHPKMSQIS